MLHKKANFTWRRRILNRERNGAICMHFSCIITIDIVNLIRPQSNTWSNLLTSRIGLWMEAYRQFIFSLDSTSQNIAFLLFRLTVLFYVWDLRYLIPLSQAKKGIDYHIKKIVLNLLQCNWMEQLNSLIPSSYCLYQSKVSTKDLRSNRSDNSHFLIAHFLIS